LVFILRIYHDARSSECQILDICVRTHAHTQTHIHHSRLQMSVTYDNKICTTIVYTTGYVVCLHTMKTNGEVEV